MQTFDDKFENWDSPNLNSIQTRTVIKDYMIKMLLSLKKPMKVAPNIRPDVTPISSSSNSNRAIGYNSRNEELNEAIDSIINTILK